ncbi:MAG: hypothetical protein AABX93_00695 [Nanoarchaeota archaeon]
MRSLEMYAGDFSLVNQGKEALIYSIGEGRVARVLHGNFNSIRECYQKLFHEYDVALEFHENGISVPQPVGVFELNVFANGRGTNYPAFVMEQIYGKTFGELKSATSREEYEKWRKRVEAEIGKAEALGFYAHDSRNKENSMLSDSGKIYLIDFGCWKKTTSQNLHKIHNSLSI